MYSIKIFSGNSCSKFIMCWYITNCIAVNICVVTEAGIGAYGFGLNA